ncbi:hypothetical protein ANCCAN_20999 [Ancylostoma caninum]|uniref:Uncharacterized protein n=1 Tax=Ancylostoma caninum TaxID=29170 RepID=A0A368FSH7_ANCCA|nr:hypothetical protein ANCCAN_20999 [Ancylostoma caninum]
MSLVVDRSLTTPMRKPTAGQIGGHFESPLSFLLLLSRESANFKPSRLCFH